MIICWSLQGEESEISAGKIRVEFIKSYRDNPKINAIVLIKVSKKKKFWLFKLSIIQGTLEDFPKLAPLPVEPEEDEVADDLKVYKQMISSSTIV